MTKDCVQEYRSKQPKIPISVTRSCELNQLSKIYIMMDKAFCLNFFVHPLNNNFERFIHQGAFANFAQGL